MPDTLVSPQTATPEASDAAFDAAFDKLATPSPTEDTPAPEVPWKKAEGDREPDPESDADPKGKDDKPATGDAKKPAEAADKAKAPRTREGREKVYSARERLRKDNWEEAEIDALTPEQLFARAERVAKRQDDADRLYAEKNNTKGQPTKAAPDSPRGRSASGASEADSTGDTGKGGIGETLEELRTLDPDLADRLEKRWDSQHRSASEERDRVVREAQERATRAAQAAFETRVTTLRTGLTEEFPSLGDDKRFMEVMEWMAEHDPRGEKAAGPHDAFSQHFKNGCWVVFGEETERRTREKLVEQNQKTRDGQPELSGPTGKTTAMENLTLDQWEDMLYEATLAANGDQQEFQRLKAMLPPRPKK